MTTEMSAADMEPRFVLMTIEWQKQVIDHLQMPYLMNYLTYSAGTVGLVPNLFPQIRLGEKLLVVKFEYGYRFAATNNTWTQTDVVFFETEEELKLKAAIDVELKGMLKDVWIPICQKRLASSQLATSYNDDMFRKLFRKTVLKQAL